MAPYLYDDKRAGEWGALPAVGQLEPEVASVALELVAGVGGGEGEVGDAPAAVAQRRQAAHIQRLAAAAQGLEEGGVEAAGAGG